MISSSAPPAVPDSGQLLRKQSWNVNSPQKLFVSRSAIGPRQPLGIVDLSVSVMANAEDTPFMASADPSVSAKPKKTKRGPKKSDNSVTRTRMVGVTSRLRSLAAAIGPVQKISSLACLS